MKFSKFNIIPFFLVAIPGSPSFRTLGDSVEASNHLRLPKTIFRAIESLSSDEEEKLVLLTNITNKTAGVESGFIMDNDKLENTNMTAEEELEAVQVMDLTYNYPFYNGRRLDWCLTWAGNCGRFAANAYCRMKGYHYAYDWRIDQNIGNTKVIGTDQDCSPSYCDGFRYIRCSPWKVDRENFYDSKRFKYPEYMGRPLDYCLVYETHCGKNAADDFCRMKGFKKASSWRKRSNLVHYTHFIGDQNQCNSSPCDTFTYIFCIKEI